MIFQKCFPIFFLLILLSCSNQLNKPAVESTNSPNIVLLLIDDAGYADFGFMGSKDLKTPHLDHLATNGIIFTDAHVSASVCAPSRAGLLTGKYQQRFGFECNALAHFQGIDTAHQTIAEMLQAANYETGAFGKWHVGDAPQARPNARGFDHFWGFLSGARSYFPNEQQDQAGHLKSIRENDQFTTFDGYLTDVLAAEAIDFIERNKNNPFFVYWSPNAVHTPMEATDEDLAKFEGHPRQRLAAMTWALDRAVGKIVDKLETEKLLENTLIFFLSDNGGASNNQSSNLPLKGWKGNKYEGGHRVAFFVHWPRGIQTVGTYDGLVSSLDIFATSAQVSRAQLPGNISLDGVSLVPVFTDLTSTSPHQQLFWRKEGMAASRSENYKMIRVDSLGYRLYDLEKDLRETHDLSATNTLQLEKMQNQIKDWEKALMSPSWIESALWNEVTWWIHHDLYHNREVRVKNPGQLKRLDLRKQ